MIMCNFLCFTGVQAQTGQGDASAKRTQVPYPEPPRSVSASQCDRWLGPIALCRRSFFGWLIWIFPLKRLLKSIKEGIFRAPIFFSCFKRSENYFAAVIFLYIYRVVMLAKIWIKIKVFKKSSAVWPQKRLTIYLYTVYVYLWLFIWWVNVIDKSNSISDVWKNSFWIGSSRQYQEAA